MYYYEKANQLSIEINFSAGKIRYHDYVVGILILNSQYDLALKHIDTAYHLSLKYKMRRWQALELSQVGTINQLKLQMKKAADYYLQSYRISESIKDTELLSLVAGNLSGIFIEIKRYDKARYFAAIGYELSQKKNDTLGMGYSLVNLATSDTNDSLFEAAKKRSYEAYLIAEKYNDVALKMFSLTNYGAALKELGNTELAIKQYEKVLEIAKSLKNDYHIVYALKDLGECNIYIGNYREAKRYFIEAIPYGEKLQNYTILSKIHLGLSICEESLNNIFESLNERKLYDNYKDSINISEQDQIINELEAKFENEQKNRKLIEQKLIIQEEKNTSYKRLILLISACILLLVSVAIIYLRLKISKQRELNLKKEMLVKELSAREDERNRLAADMHDDLGAGLSTIRMISELSKNKPIDELKIDINKISIRSEELVESMRQMIWAMSNNNDTVEDLYIYIRIYSKQFLDDHQIQSQINFPDDKNDRKVSSEIRRSLFLITKEILHNTVKHANASMVNINMNMIGSNFSISFHDNGKGIIKQDVKTFGNGIKNIRSRVKDLNGEFTIESLDGTLVKIDIPL
jgi:signal transduction histidine kinase